MRGFAGVAGADAAGAAARLQAPDGSEQHAEDGLALVWGGTEATAARVRDVLCVAAGTAGAAAIAAAWAERGADGLADVAGTFGAVVWDRVARRGALLSDPLGTRSPVYRPGARGIVFALELVDLLRLLESRPAPDAAAVTAWLAWGELSPGRTLFDDIRRLPGGHVLELDRAPLRRRYWAPRYEPPDPVGREEAEARVREAVEAAVGRAAARGERPGVLLSGGLDSAAVAAASRRAGRPPHAYSLVFPDDPAVDESELIEHVSREVGLPSTRVPHDPGRGLLEATAAHVSTWAVPPASPLLAVHAPLLARASADGVDVLLDGQGGDELFASYLELLADLVRSGRLRDARRLAHRIDGIPERVRGRAARRALVRYGVAPLVPERARRFARRVRAPAPAAPWLRRAPARAAPDRVEGPAWWRALADAVTRQRERAGAHDHLRHRNADAGVTGAHPFLQDRELVELVLRLPPELAFDAERDRPLLRGAMRGVVPQRILDRRDKAFFTPLLVRAVAETDAAEIRQLLLAPGAEIGAYADPAVIRRLLLDAPPGRRRGAWALATWRLAAIELWLRWERG